MTQPFRFLSAIACVLLVAAFAHPASASGGAPVIGQASVIDGDTLEVHGQRIRLHGIDAPESRQTCGDAQGKPYRCGAVAANALSELIARRPVTCLPRDTDRYGRTIAQCSVAGTDLNGWLVGRGHALAYRQYSQAYIAAESRARAARAGIHAGSFEAPWDFRRSARSKRSS